tara:strand:- start:49263 stop:49904 length:642 start_codon:yes stop_codon:yes gene_type:complete
MKNVLSSLVWAQVVFNKELNMLKFLLLLLIGVAGLSQSAMASTVSGNSGSFRLCVVDLDALQEPYRKKIEAELAKIAEEFKAEFSGLETELKKEKSELDVIKENLQKNPKMTEPVGFQQRLKSFEEKVQEALKKEEEKRKMLQELVLRVEEKFADALRQTLKEFGTKEGYQLILPRGGVLEASDSLDCTKQVESNLSKKNEEIFGALKGSEKS